MKSNNFNLPLITFSLCQKKLKFERLADSGYGLCKVASIAAYYDINVAYFLFIFLFLPFLIFLFFFTKAAYQLTPASVLQLYK